MSHYRVYGLAVRSPIALPCPRTISHERPDVTFDRGSTAQFARAREMLGSGGRADSWFVHHEFPDGTRYLRWTGLSEFLVSPDGHRILIHRLNGATAESLGVYLLGQVLSFPLLAFGREPLHGTVVVANGQGVGFLGDCGHGKSTLAAALVSRGLRLLTDDLIVAERRAADWMIESGVPRLKLFPSVARRFFGPEARGTAMNRGTSKVIIPLGPVQAAGGAVPLRALYVLSNPQETRGNGRLKPRIEPLSRAEAFLEVVRAAFNLIVLDTRRLATQFALAEQLSAEVPIRRIVYPRTFAMLSDTCEAVLANLENADVLHNSGACRADSSSEHVAGQAR